MRSLSLKKQVSDRLIERIGKNREIKKVKGWITITILLELKAAPELIGKIVQVRKVAPEQALTKRIKVR